MNIEFKLPELGENVKSGDVVSVLVREGDVIAANDGVIELETDKAVVEIPCPYAGKVTKVHVTKGQTIKVGQPVLTIESGRAGKAATGGRAGSEAASRRRRRQSPRPAVAQRKRRPAGRARPGPRRGGWPASWASICRESRAAARAGGSPSRTFARRGCRGRRPPRSRRGGVRPRDSRPAWHPRAGRAARRIGRRRLWPRPPRADVEDPPHDRRPDGQVGQHHPARHQLRRRRRDRPGADAQDDPAGVSRPDGQADGACRLR